jgi:integrase
VGDKKAAAATASTIRAKLQLGEFGFEDPKPVPTFGEYSKRWLRFVESQCKGKESKYKLSISKVSKRLFSKNGHKKKPIVYFLMAARTGMRLGELLALEWVIISNDAK